jgi:hypothetical protein
MKPKKSQKFQYLQSYFADSKLALVPWATWTPPQKAQLSGPLKTVSLKPRPNLRICTFSPKNTELSRFPYQFAASKFR